MSVYESKPKYALSVIIPMYNTAKFIVSCVNELFLQDVDGLEIVVVNDCSTDNSMELCREHFAGRENIRLIDQPSNMGPGIARNTGILAARGRYVTFVDSDDAVRPDAYRIMLDAAIRENADVLHVTGVLMQTVDNAPVNMNDLTEDEVFRATLDEGPQITSLTILPNDMEQRLAKWLSHEIHWAIWNKLYRRDFLLENNILFGSMRLAEDQVFCFHCLCRADRYVILPGEWYLYRLGTPSVSRGIKQSLLLIKALRAQLDMPEYMSKAVDGISYFTTNPEKKAAAIKNVFDVLEKGFVVPAIRNIGIDVLQSDADLHDMFVEYFGKNSFFAENEFYLAHAHIPDGESIYDMITTPAFWRKLKRNEGSVNVEC